MTIHIPIVITISLGTIDFLQISCLSRFQIKQPLFALIVPNREIAIVNECEKDVFTIIRRSWPCETLTHLDGIEYRIDLLTKLSCFGVKVYLTQIILFIFILQWVLSLITSHVI